MKTIIKAGLCVAAIAAYSYSFGMMAPYGDGQKGKTSWQEGFKQALQRGDKASAENIFAENQKVFQNSINDKHDFHVRVLALSFKSDKCNVENLNFVPVVLNSFKESNWTITDVQQNVGVEIIRIDPQAAQKPIVRLKQFCEQQKR